MAFEASSQIPTYAYERARALANRMKNFLTTQRNIFVQSGDMDQIIEVLKKLNEYNTDFSDFSSVPGIAQYAKDQQDDQAYNVVGEFNAMVTAVVSARDWIVVNMPDDGTYLLGHTIELDGSVTPRPFTSGQLSGLVTELDAVIATVA